MDDRDRAKTELVMENVHLRRRLAEAEQRLEWAKGRDGLTEKERRILDMWPRFEGGEPVMSGDEAVMDDCQIRVCSVEFRKATYALVGEDGKDALIGTLHERVKRPAPEVLDADGAPIEEGDTVYEADAGEEYEVEHIFSDTTEPDYPDHTVRCRKKSDFIEHMFRPDQLTHVKPVLDANGDRIREGDTVWHEDGTELRVTGFGDEQDGEVMVIADYVAGPTEWGEVRNLSLTHAGPDSWGKLEQDAVRLMNTYWGCGNTECEECPIRIDGKTPKERYGVAACSTAKELDIIHRAKALAGVE